MLALRREADASTRTAQEVISLLLNFNSEQLSCIGQRFVVLLQSRHQTDLANTVCVSIASRTEEEESQSEVRLQLEVAQ